MTTIELAEKVEATRQKIQKIEATIERHRKALEKHEKKLLELQKQEAAGADVSRDIYWTECDVRHKEGDIKSSMEKLEDAKRLLEARELAYKKSAENDRVIEENTPQIIKDYLEKWKADAFDWYMKKFDDYQAFKDKLKLEELEVRKKAIEELDEYARYRGREMTYSDYINMYPSRPVDKLLKEARLDYSSVQRRKKEFAGTVVLKMCEQASVGERVAWLNEHLDAEKREMVLDLITRLREHVGTITDASGLRVGYAGLEGLITGDKGKVRLEAIEAGGYNIQCWHVRVLIHPVKEKEPLDERIAKMRIRAGSTGNRQDPVKQDITRE